MKVAGVIAEYNPFHNGHKYQLQTLRKQTGADYIIIAMSGNFLQRGVPAIVDKYTRTRMALENGADLVLELPVIWSTASAEYFARAGVTLLKHTGVVDYLGYGVEQHMPQLRTDIVSLLNDTPKAYMEGLLRYQKQGLSFPFARAASLCTLLPQYSSEEIQEFLCQPNNILSLEYEKALAVCNKANTHPISSVPITRIGDGYHASSVQSSFASATAIRKLLHENPSSEHFTDIMPTNAYNTLKQAHTNHLTLSLDDFSGALYHQLIAEQKKGYERFADCTQDLSCRIASKLVNFSGFTSFCELLKSKELTYTRINRVLLHILLGITKEDYALGNELSYIPYLRTLGFRKDAAPLLSEIKKNAAAPLITKVADAKKRISKEAYPLFEADLYASDIYRGMLQIQSGQILSNEFNTELVVVL